MEFKKKYGHCEISLEKKDTASSHYQKLAGWIRFQKAAYLKGQMDPERIRRLETLGFQWGGIKDKRWNAYFLRLAALKNKGHAINFHQDTKLNTWCARQRQRYLRGELELERKTLLESIGFKWVLKQNYWDIHFRMLAEFKATQGHCNVFGHQNGSLRRWIVSHQESHVAYGI